MLYALGVIIFALGLLLSIALHEVGHMVPAKTFGVKVTQYMVGFGPTLWSRKRGDTEYGLKAIPLGGYIRMIGMVPPRTNGTVSRWPRRLATSIEDFRRISRAEVEPGDGPREFYRLTPGKKIIVMLGGPTMNLVIYLVLTVCLLGILGTPHDDSTTTVGTVSQCVFKAGSPEAAKGTCATPNSPAVLAGLQPKDKIVSLAGVSITSWGQAVKIIEAAPKKALPMVVQRGGNDVSLTITPVQNLKYANATGTKTKEAGFIGVSPTNHHYYQAVSPAAIPGQIVDQISTGARALASYPEKIGSLWNTVFHGKPRDINGAIGVVGIGRLGGDLAQTNRLDVQDKVFSLIGLLASVNLLLFFFNLLPLLPLDGGHVAGALVEAVKRGRARLKGGRQVEIGPDGTPMPGRPQIFVDTAQMLPVMYAVASVLILLTLLTFYADIVKPVHLFGG
ncbi:MAG: site-2 protease family protein [Actinomycetota bacterium]|nr:site-2 protease family protein [Actinomycetota bacterium]